MILVSIDSKKGRKQHSVCACSKASLERQDKDNLGICCYILNPRRNEGSECWFNTSLAGNYVKGTSRLCKPRQFSSEQRQSLTFPSLSSTITAYSFSLSGRQGGMEEDV